jgi:hypothetical protein
VRGLTILVHGDSKSGKSWFGDTTPAPRLVLDAEAGSRFTPSKKIPWNVAADAPPEYDGTWDTAIVSVRDYQDVKRAYEWLNSGKHPFKSVVLDSISEIQQRCVDAIAGSDIMKTQDWGTLLREVSGTVRKFRDLVTHPVMPLESVVMIAMSRDSDGKKTPYVQGQLATTLPYYLDIVGYMKPIPDETGALHRYMMIQPSDEYVSGERVGGRLGPFIENPSAAVMLDTVFGPVAQ